MNCESRNASARANGTRAASGEACIGPRKNRLSAFGCFQCSFVESGIAVKSELTLGGYVSALQGLLLLPMICWELGDVVELGAGSFSNFWQC